ncbi:MAG TPA: hypothetical protein VFX60_06815 [Micromonospora sp.]|nr:hypothetical protein [Micromonospora sp.]
MQPGYPPGQDPYGQQPPHDPTAPQYQDPYAQQQPSSGQPYQDPYAQQQPISGQPYPGGTYPAAGYGMPGQPQGQSNTLGLIGMILGIVSIPFGLCCGLFTAPFALAGMVLGFLGLNKANQGQASNRGQALAGLICGGVGLVLGIIMFIVGNMIDINDFT